MTTQTNQLEAALDRLQRRLTQADTARLVQESPGLADDQRVFFESQRYREFAQAMAEHEAALERCLRQLRGLEAQLARMAQAAKQVPHADRWREEARIDSLSNDLDRVRRKAARAAFALLDFKGGFEPSTLGDLLKAVNDLLQGIGQQVDLNLTHTTLIQTTQNPAFRSAAGSAGVLTGELVAQQLFAVVGLAIVLARWFKNRRR